ncbi:hypothetical protein CVT26_001943, partial [Gymnopilus dilepis]
MVENRPDTVGRDWVSQFFLQMTKTAIPKPSMSIIVEMDIGISGMECEIQGLLRQRASACRLRNSHVPAVCLPFEIISKIFAFGLVAYEEDKVAGRTTTLPLTLGKVCHTWRSAAWSSSQLWSTFSLRITKDRCSVQAILLQEWLERSGRRPLSIDISIGDEDAWTDPADFGTQIIDVLVAHCD